MNVYVPRAGSVAARALAHLTEFGGALSTAALAEAIDVDASSLPGSLEYAVRNGVIGCEKRKGLNWWSAGDGVPLPPREQDDEPLSKGTDIDQASPRRQDWKPAAQPAVEPLSGENSAPAPEPAPHKARPETHRPVAIAATATNVPIGVALFNTGDLLLELPDQPVVRLSRAQTRELVNYLERIRDAIAETDAA